MQVLDFIGKIGTCWLALIFLTTPTSAAAKFDPLADLLSEEKKTLHQTVPSPPTDCPKHNYWLLSLDGGGVRVLMQLITLVLIEERTGTSVIDLFDAIAGTSAGGLVAALLTLPDPANPLRPKYSAKQILMLLIENKEEFLKPKWQSFRGILSPRCKTRTYKNTLETLFGENTFKNRLLPTVLVAQNLHSYGVHFFSTTDAQDFSTISAVLASGAAPTYHNPQHVTPLGASRSESRLIGDGGPCMNNPVLAGMTLVQQHYKAPLEHIHTLSLGTGVLGVSRESAPLQRAGAFRWLGELPDLFLTGQESVVNHFTRLFCKGRYHRFNPVLTLENLDIMGVADEKILAFFKATHVMLAEKSAELSSVIESLRETSQRKKLECPPIKTTHYNSKSTIEAPPSLPKGDGVFERLQRSFIANIFRKLSSSLTSRL